MTMGVIGSGTEPQSSDPAEAGRWPIRLPVPT